jgi:hypothetical protein
MKRIVKELNKWKTCEKEFDFMKRKNVNVFILENDLDEDRMNLFIFKRLILEMNLQIKNECLSIWLINYEYYWCKKRTASIDDDEYQIWFSRFLAHKTMFSAFEAQTDESRCLIWD